MTDEIFRQTRKQANDDDGDMNEDSKSNPLEKIQTIQEAVSKETGKDIPRSMNESPFQMAGKIPPAFKAALDKKQITPNKANNDGEESEGYENSEAPPDRKRTKAATDAKIRVQGSDALEGLLQQLADKHSWEEFEFPSKGRFYENVPPVVNVRAMTGEEEQILATPRWVRKGKAIDMIFRRCIKESINTEELLSADRTHLLIFLRGISYTPEYDVEIKCPNCTTKFAHIIDLNQMEVNPCPDTFSTDSLSGSLPVSKFSYIYRLPTGQDEQEISSYREKRIQQWGDQGEDDTLLYRTALLLEEIEGVTMKKELSLLLKKLPIQDVAYLRNEINTPPFGVDTELPILCPSCSEEFKIDLPLETNFFFPRKKVKETEV